MIRRIFNKIKASEKQARSTEVVLHVGAPKCGSSAIQRFSVAHRDALLALGYYYPEHPLDKNGVSGGHNQLAALLAKDKGSWEEASVVFKKWLNEARKHNACLLLSSESFYGQHLAFAQICQGLQVRVVSFLRHPIEYLLANHNQGIKRHNSTKRLGQTLSESLRRNTGHLVGLPLLQWAEAFGDDQCCFMTYQSPGLGIAPLEEQFLTALGISAKQAAPLLSEKESVTNRSYVKSALELKRLLNTVLEELPDRSAHQVDWCLQGYSDHKIDERSYDLSDLESYIRDDLEKSLLIQMEPVIKRFPELGQAAELPYFEPAASRSYWLDLASPLAVLESEIPDVMSDIRLHATELLNQGRNDYVFCKLLDILGIEFIEPKGDKSPPGLTLQQRTVLNKEQAREADCLRELAVLLERQGLLGDALFAINCALARRPNGTGILRIKARIEEQLKRLEMPTDAQLNKTGVNSK